MDKLKALADNKIFKIFMQIIRVVLIGILCIFVLVVCLQRFSDNKLSFFNYRIFTVVSGSMKPEYNIGDVLIAKKVEPSSIKIGDDISYLGLSGDVRDKTVTHRVIEIEKNNGTYKFHTQGLSNLFEDPVVTADQIFGKVVFKSVFLSTIYKIISTKAGLYFCVVIPIMIIVATEVVASAIAREDKKRGKA